VALKAIVGGEEAPRGTEVEEFASKVPATPAASKDPMAPSTSLFGLESDNEEEPRVFSAEDFDEAASQSESVALSQPSLSSSSVAKSLRAALSPAPAASKKQRTLEEMLGGGKKRPRTKDEKKAAKAEKKRKAEQEEGEDEYEVGGHLSDEDGPKNKK
jgi:hypothetical protein